jgi:cardiolipin synthase
MALQALPQFKSVYPWRDDTHCELLVDITTFMPAMLESIRTARHYILLEMYLVESGSITTQLIDALLEAAKRNITIRIIFDDFGTRELNNTDRARLTHPAIEIAFYHPLRLTRLHQYLFRDHRKLLLVDGEVAFTGGVGFSDGLLTESGSRSAWHDVVVQFKGKVVDDWQDLFITQWRRITSIQPSLTTDRPESEHEANQGCRARLVSSQPARINPIYGHLRQRATLARHRLWIATAYFLPSWRLRRVIRQAAQRGVDVRLLLPGPITDNPAVRYASQRFYLNLLKAGVRIHEYQPAFMHAKTTLVDDWASVGSSNFDRWSMSRNLEANQEISDSKFAAALEEMFRQDFLQAEEITIDSWVQRPALQRWREYIWGMLETWLNKRNK